MYCFDVPPLNTILAYQLTLTSNGSNNTQCGDFKLMMPILEISHLDGLRNQDFITL